MRVLAVALVLELAASSIATELLLFGGRDHDVFLACLNCSRYDSGSVCNRYSENGSRYGDKSIWNRYGDFGSRYSEFSPWNRYASNPPVIVDRDGNFYGYFTANRFRDKRTKIKTLVILTDNVDWVIEDLARARDAFCGDS